MARIAIPAGSGTGSPSTISLASVIPRSRESVVVRQMEAEIQIERSVWHAQHATPIRRVVKEVHEFVEDVKWTIRRDHKNRRCPGSSQCGFRHSTRSRSTDQNAIELVTGCAAGLAPARHSRYVQIDGIDPLERTRQNEWFARNENLHGAISPVLYTPLSSGSGISYRLACAGTAIPRQAKTTNRARFTGTS